MRHAACRAQKKRMNFHALANFPAALLAAEETKLPSDVGEKADLAKPVANFSRDEMAEWFEIAQDFTSDCREMSARRGRTERSGPCEAIVRAGERQ